MNYYILAKTNIFKYIFVIYPFHESFTIQTEKHAWFPSMTTYPFIFITLN